MKAIRKCLIAGIILIAIGAGIIITVLAVNGWSIKETNYTMETFKAENDNTAVEIYLGANSLKTEFYDGEKIEISYPVSKAFKTSVSEKNGKLKFESKTKWYYSFFNFTKAPETVVKIPKDKVFDIKVDLGAGTISLDGGVYGNLNIDVSAGTLKGSNITCGNLDIDVSAGTLALTGVTCDKIVCDVSAGTLNIKELTCPDVKADVSAGKLSMSINGLESEYTVRASVSAGSCNLKDRDGTTDKKLYADCSTGSVSVTFNN